MLKLEITNDETSQDEKWGNYDYVLSIPGVVTITGHISGHSRGEGIAAPLEIVAGDIDCKLGKVPVSP